MMREEIPECLLSDKSQGYIIQYSLRIVIVVLGLLSSMAIFIACVCSRKMKHWPFRLLAVQTFSECLVLIGALSLNYKSSCYPFTCKIIGYVMHSNWLVSFCCSFTIIYMYYKTIKFDYSVEWWIQHIQNWRILIVIEVFAYLWLLYPLIREYFGSTGWMLRDGEQFTIFCGFTSKVHEEYYWTVYTFFFALPIFVIFVFGVFFACKNSNTASIILCHIKDQNLWIIKKMQIFPGIYVFFWVLNLIVRYYDILADPPKSAGFYYLYVIINLLHELHMCVIFVVFYLNFSKILNLKQIWFNALCRFRRYLPPTLEVYSSESSLDLKNDLIQHSC